MAFAGGEESESKGEELPRRRRRARVRGRSRSKMQRFAVVGAAESFARSGNGAEERELEVEDGVWEKEEAKALPCGLYGRRGRGVGCGCGCVARCGLAHRKTNRQTGARNPGAGGKACDVGIEACGYVKSRVGRGSQPIDCIPGKSEITVGKKSARDCTLKK